jgi:DeoR family transcriptional regulator, fructose operon transcriptional repressor
MFAEERQKQILQYINEHTRASVAELTSVFHVSEATIRRDLKELEEGGLLRRTHGGALANQSVGFEPTFSEKTVHHADEKKRIAAKAMDWVGEGDTVLLDSGTTTYQMVPSLASFRVLTVVTNSYRILQELEQAESLELVSTGGIVRKGTQSLVGPIAEQVLEMVKVDKVFLGTNALDLEAGLTTPNLYEAQMKKAVIRAASQVILLCDSSKIGKTSFAKVAAISEVDVWITDERAPAEVVKQVRDSGVEVILV